MLDHSGPGLIPTCDVDLLARPRQRAVPCRFANEGPRERRPPVETVCSNLVRARGVATRRIGKPININAVASERQFLCLDHVYRDIRELLVYILVAAIIRRELKYARGIVRCALQPLRLLRGSTGGTQRGLFLEAALSPSRWRLSDAGVEKLWVGSVTLRMQLLRPILRSPPRGTGGKSGC